jgi:hypothetical protein
VSGRGGRGLRGGPEDRSSEAFAVGDVVDELFRRRELAPGIPAGRLHREWAMVVGDRLAGVSAPIRLERGTLVVAVDSGPWGAQVGFLSEEVRRRANEVLGTDVVTRVQVVVDPARARSGRPPREPSNRGPATPREPLGRNDSEEPPIASR